MNRSVDVIFPAPGIVEVVESEVASPGEGQITCRALVSLVSTGTETFCLAGTFDPGTFWEEATLDEHAAEPTQLLRETLRWKKGHFTFRSAEGAPRGGGPRQAIGGLLIEAMRLEDEARR